MRNKVVILLLILSLILNLYLAHSVYDLARLEKEGNTARLRQTLILVDWMHRRVPGFIQLSPEDARLFIDSGKSGEWRNILTNSRDMLALTEGLALQRLDKHKDDIFYLRRILGITNATLMDLNRNFIESGSLTLTPEGLKKVAALTAIYGIIAEEIKMEGQNLEIEISPHFLQDIVEPLKIIDKGDMWRYIEEYLEERVE